MIHFRNHREELCPKAIHQKLFDNYGRTFRYLRLSLTDACNFKCTYCLPNGYQKGCKEPSLTTSEIIRLVEAFSDLGIEKVRLTGGEPTLRRDLLEIISEIRKVRGIDKVSLTTNGFRFPNILKDLRTAGLTSLNVSVDSLTREGFKTITGRDELEKVLIGIEEALELGFDSVKLNTVLLKDLNHHEFENFVEFTENHPVSVRFIELMRTGDNGPFFERHHLCPSGYKLLLESRGWRIDQRDLTSGPADTYSHPNFRGKVGFISAYSKDFCKSCNRLRVTSSGNLRLCLFGTGEASLRSLLQARDQRDELKDKIIELLKLKTPSHRLFEGDVGDTPSLSVMGG